MIRSDGYQRREELEVMRKPMLRRRSDLLFVLPFLFCLATPAHAYLDPASGSMILQLLLGGIAGAAVLIRLYWHKLLDILGVKKSGDDDAPV